MAQIHTGMPRTRWLRPAVLCGWLAVTAVGQQPTAVGRPPTPTTETKTPERPTHAPKPTLPPLLAWHHVRAGNAAWVQAQAEREDAPTPAPRPSGAGRYVCAVITCADADVDVAALLGLRRRDVLLLSVPGPFVTPDAVALLEQTVTEHHLSLVIVLGHADCRTLATRRGETEHQDATARRVAAARTDAERDGAPLLPHLLRAQCLRLCAASDLLRRHALADTLRVLPAQVDGRTGAITWHHERADEYALRPIR